MKKFVKCLLILIILPMAFLFVGCSSEQLESIQSITKTIDGLKEILTSDGLCGKINIWKKH